MGTATFQGQLWGIRARDWAEVQEGISAPLFEEIINKTAVETNTALLDVGCGSGGLCQMAVKYGAEVSGLDAAEPLLAIARERVPQGDFRVGEMEELPYANQTFDIITGINAFQFAANPVNAFKEARRVARKGGSLVIAVFGRPEDTEATAYFAALASLLPPPAPGRPGPFSLSLDGTLVATVRQAGMDPGEAEWFDWLWRYPDESTLLRGLLSSAPSNWAIQRAGEDAVREAILKALAPFKMGSGGYQLRNKIRIMIVKT